MKCEDAEVLVDACRDALVWIAVDQSRRVGHAVGFVLRVDVPVGLRCMSPFKRPISSSSVHGSCCTCSVGLAGELAAGVGVLGCDVEVGDAA